MNRFPLALYIAGGSEPIDGLLFTSRVVHDEAQFEAAQAEGWHETTEAALSAQGIGVYAPAQPGEPAEPPKQADVPAEPQPITRADLEAQAKSLGIDFRSNLSDAKLAERIAAKLAEKQD